MIFNFREDWKPVLTINAIVYGIQYLFLEPNPDDPLNKGIITCFSIHPLANSFLYLDKGHHGLGPVHISFVKSLLETIQF